jgi:Kef-type K+ transport system membrane component KefB
VAVLLSALTTEAIGVHAVFGAFLELIVLNIGLDLGVISPTLFAMMVVMALATTALTAPVLQWLLPAASTEVDPSPALSASA